MEKNQEKINAIIDLLKPNLGLASEEISKLIIRISEIETTPDEDFDIKGDAEFGRETKFRHVKALQHQLGYLAAIQAEYLKIFNFLYLDASELKQLKENELKAVEEFRSEIKETIDKTRLENNDENN